MTKPLKVVLIEDQRTLAQHMQRLLERQPGCRCVAVAHNVADAIVIIPACSPDLVIMDIELGEGTAFDILKALHPLHFQVVFVTGFQEYAIKAIKFGAMDYLLKPVDETELAAALQKAYQPIPAREQIELSHQHLLHPGISRRIAVRNGDILKLVDIDQIIYLQGGEGKGTQLHLLDGQQLASRKTMGEFEELLPVHHFLRIHASTIVNISYVDYYRPPDTIVLRNGIELTVAARRKDGIMAYLTGHKFQRP